MASTTYRLPRQVIPTAYEINLDATPRRNTFSGVLVLKARVIVAANSFELNAIDLKISDVVAYVGKKKLCGRVKQHKEHESVELIFPQPLAKGKLELSLAFTGKLNNSMHGLYLAKDGPERAIVSQCEATDARRIFPCFDEPDLKATIKWTIITDPDLTVITNGVQKKVSKGRKKPIRATYFFKPTRVISTYLAAVTIGKYVATPVKRIAGILCRALCGEGKLEQTSFAQEVTAWVLPWYQDYFGQKYNYQKLDQVAVPGFDAGAMENVGAIFYRQSLLLMDAGATSWQAQKRIAEVVAHEIAHQWFGNLVTMCWWDDLWLNEAFATWIAFKTIDQFKPHWRIWDEYLQSKETALDADSLVNTHPVYTPVQSPAEATELFDVITYEKGGGVLRMIESYIGEENFREGIRQYQAAFKNANATGKDLWQKLAHASSQPVDELMQGWINQKGFPLVTVNASEVNNCIVLHISQRRFFANASEMQNEHEQLWPIPLIIRYGSGNGSAVHRLVLHKHEQTVTLPSDTKAAWIFANDGATGFYRVKLADDLLDDLLKHGIDSLDPASRMSLIEDQWALVRAGLSDIECFMNIIKEFRNERDYLVVRTIAARLAYFEQRLVRDEDRELLREFVRWLFTEQLEDLTWDTEPDEDEARAVRRAAVIRTLGDVGRDVSVLEEAERRAQVEMQQPANIDPNLAGVIVALGALRGGRERFDKYMHVYQDRKKQRTAPELQARYLGALYYFEDTEAIDMVLSSCLNGSIPQEQLRLVLIPLLTRNATQRTVWEFVKQHWQDIGTRVGLMGVSRLVEATGALPVELATDIAEFFKKHPVDEAKRALAKALEALELRRELIEREALRLSDWLQERSWISINE
ncbi:MAG: M1 family metallopeptidase [Deltaproteobacteria bacterium]|nr:M1 family metallopeptidase [Deltaproteobacteria bacterium]